MLEYACVIWNDASEHLKTSLIDNIQHRVLARAMGVRKATSGEALEIEAGVEPLELRRKMLTAKTYQRLVAGPSKIAAVLEQHKQKAVPILHSPLNSSFALSGERLQQSEYPKGCNFKAKLKEHWQSRGIVVLLAGGSTTSNHRFASSRRLGRASYPVGLSALSLA